MVVEGRMNMLYGLFLSLILVLGAWLMGRMWQGRCMVVKKRGAFGPFFLLLYVSFVMLASLVVFLGQGKGREAGCGVWTLVLWLLSCRWGWWCWCWGCVGVWRVVDEKGVGFLSKRGWRERDFWFFLILHGWLFRMSWIPAFSKRLFHVSMSCALFFSLKLSFLLLLFFSLLICHFTNDKGLLLILIPSYSSPPYVKRMNSTCLWDTLFLVVFYDKFIPNLLHWKIHVLCAGSFIKSYTSYRFILILMDGVCVPTLVCKYFSVVCVHNQYSHVEKERLISNFLLKLFFLQVG